MPTYINKTAQHNKFWEYVVSGLTVTVKYGRVGSTTRTKIHNLGSSYEVQAWIDKTVRGKLKKGYILSTTKELKQESQTAKMLGIQYKISRMLFVSQKGKKLTRISGYDPKKYVYVEILNSWKKDKTRLLLSKTESFLLTGSVIESGRTITYGNKSATSGKFVKGVRSVLRRMSEQLVEVIKTIKFAAVGARKLFDDDDDETPTQEFSMEIKKVAGAGLDLGVVSKFASMGARVLEL